MTKKEKKEQAKRLYNKGKTVEEIASIIRVTYGTSAKYIRELKAKGEIKTRTEQIADLYNAGISIKDIAEQLKITYYTATKHVKKAKEAGIIKGKPKINDKRLQAICNKTNLNESDFRYLERYIDVCQKKIEVKKLQIDDLARMKEVVDVTHQYTHIITYIKACICLNQIEEAESIIQTHINNKDFTRRPKRKI